MIQMDSKFQDQFFAALRSRVTEYKDDIPVLTPEQVIEVFEQVKGSKMEAKDVPHLAGAYMYVGIEYPDVDDFWFEWYECRDQADGQA
jgi:hypothetical protein